MKKVILITLILCSLNSHSESVSSKNKTIYLCPDIHAVESCSNQCEFVQKSSVVFLIDKQINTVLKKSYFDNNFQSSAFYRDCRIFDTNNWECKDGNTTDSMTDGVYFHKNYNLRNDTYDVSRGSPFFCAK
jgi:hypothetical protein